MSTFYTYWWFQCIRYYVGAVISIFKSPIWPILKSKHVKRYWKISGLTQLVTFPTREESILDLVLSSHSDLVSDIHSTEGISDHSAVSFDLNLTIKMNKKKPRSAYKFNNTDFSKVRMLQSLAKPSSLEIHWIILLSIIGNLSKRVGWKSYTRESLKRNWVHGVMPHGWQLI